MSIQIVGIIITIFAVISISRSSLPSELEDGEKYETNITVGTGELMFDFDPMGARVESNIRLLDANNLGEYYVKLRGEGNKKRSCGRGCEEDVAVSETCTNLDGEEFSTDFSCKIHEQPDDDWTFYLSVRCENSKCSNYIAFEISLTRNEWEGYGFKVLDVMIYTGIIFVANVGVLVACLLASWYVITCCIIPFGFSVGVAKNDKEAVCCFILGIPLMFVVYCGVVCGADYFLFVCTLMTITVIMTVCYWCPYCVK